MATNRYFNRQVGQYNPVLRPMPFEHMLAAGMGKQQGLDNARLANDAAQDELITQAGKSTVGLSSRRNAYYQDKLAKTAAALEDPNIGVNESVRQIRNLNREFKSDKAVQLINDDFALRPIGDKTEAEQMFQSGQFESDAWDYDNNQWKQYTEDDAKSGVQVGAGRYAPVYDGNFFKENQAIIDQVKPDVIAEVNAELGINTMGQYLGEDGKYHSMDEKTSAKKRALTRQKIRRRLEEYTSGLNPDLSTNDMSSVRFRNMRGKRTGDTYDMNRYSEDLVNQGLLGIFDETTTSNVPKDRITSPAASGRQKAGNAGGFFPGSYIVPAAAENIEYDPNSDIKGIKNVRDVAHSGEALVYANLNNAGFQVAKDVEGIKDGTLLYDNGLMVESDADQQKAAEIINEVHARQEQMQLYEKRATERFDKEQKANNLPTLAEIHANLDLEKVESDTREHLERAKYTKRTDHMDFEYTIDGVFPGYSEGTERPSAFNVEGSPKDRERRASNAQVHIENLQNAGYVEGVDYTIETVGASEGGKPRHGRKKSAYEGHPAPKITDAGYEKMMNNAGRGEEWSQMIVEAHKNAMAGNEDAARALANFNKQVEEDFRQVAESKQAMLLNYNDGTGTDASNPSPGKANNPVHQEFVQHIRRYADLGGLKVKGSDMAFADHMPKNMTANDFKPSNVYLDRDEQGRARWYSQGKFSKEGENSDENQFGDDLPQGAEKMITVDVTDLMDDITGLQEIQKQKVMGTIKDAMLMTRKGEPGVLSFPQPKGAPDLRMDYEEAANGGIILKGEVFGMDENGQVQKRSIEDVLKESGRNVTFPSPQEAADFLMQAWDSAKNVKTVAPHRFDDNNQLIPRDVPKEVPARKTIVSQEAATISADFPDYVGDFASDLTELIGFESGHTYDPGQPNKKDGIAMGLIQFYPDAGETDFKTIKGKKYQMKDLANMSIPEQMGVVREYLSENATKVNNRSDLYFSVFFPAFVGVPPNKSPKEALDFMYKQGVSKSFKRKFGNTPGQALDILMASNPAYANAETLADIPDIVYGT